MVFIVMNVEIFTYFFTHKQKIQHSILNKIVFQSN